jgi:hypothetical protein
LWVDIFFHKNWNSYDWIIKISQEMQVNLLTESKYSISIGQLQIAQFLLWCGNLYLIFHVL